MKGVGAEADDWRGFEIGGSVSLPLTKGQKLIGGEVDAHGSTTCVRMSLVGFVVLHDGIDGDRRRIILALVLHANVGASW